MSRFPSEAVNIISRQLGPAPTRVLLERLEAAGFSLIKDGTPAELAEMVRAARRIADYRSDIDDKTIETCRMRFADPGPWPVRGGK